MRGFTSRVSPYRPEGEALIERGEHHCNEAVTDQSSVDVRWQPALAPASHLHLYYGCDVSENRGMIDALYTAPQFLPIADLIGRR